MLARIRKAMDRDEAGFTLIELLVVIIIIGILAAIAIPTFLRQKQKGYQAAMVNDLKNLQLAEESWATDNGSYVTVTANAGDLTTSGGLAPEAGKTSEGVNLTTGVTITTITAGATGSTGDFCIQVANSNVSGVTYALDKLGDSTKTPALTAGVPVKGGAC